MQSVICPDTEVCAHTLRWRAQQHSYTFKKLQQARAEATSAKAELRETRSRWRQRKVDWQKQSQKHAKVREKFNRLLQAVRTEKEARTTNA